MLRMLFASSPLRWTPDSLRTWMLMSPARNTKDVGSCCIILFQLPKWLTLLHFCTSSTNSKRSWRQRTLRRFVFPLARFFSSPPTTTSSPRSSCAGPRLDGHFEGPDVFPLTPAAGLVGFAVTASARFYVRGVMLKAFVRKHGPLFHGDTISFSTFTSYTTGKEIAMDIARR